MSNEELIDRLIGRIITSEELARLAASADRDATVWEDVAAALVAERTLDSGARLASAVAEAVEFPATSSRTYAWWGWSGWAAAAVVAIASMIPWSLGPARPSADGVAVESVPDAPVSPDVAFANYLASGADDGRVIRELPVVTVDVRAASEGRRTEIIYVRRVLERREVDGLLRVARDEHGRPTIVPAAIGAARAPQSL